MKVRRRLWQQGWRGKFAVIVSLFLLLGVGIAVCQHGEANGLFGDRTFVDLKVQRLEVSGGRSISYRAVGTYQDREIKVPLWSNEYEAIKPGDVIRVIAVPGWHEAFLRRGAVAYDPQLAVPFFVIMGWVGLLSLLALVGRYFNDVPRFSRNADFIDRSVVSRSGER